MADSRTYQIDVSFQEKVLLNSLAEAAAHVRNQTENVIQMASKIRRELEDGFTLTRNFGHNTLPEAVAKYNALEDMIAITLESNGKQLDEINALTTLARVKKLDAPNGVYYFRTGVVTFTI